MKSGSSTAAFGATAAPDLGRLVDALAVGSRLLFQTASAAALCPPVINGLGARPLPPAIWAIVRPDAIERSSRQHGIGVVIARIFVAVLDQQPVGSFSPRPIVLHPDENPAAVQALAVERELEVAALKCRLRRLSSFRFPVAAVPELHRAAAVFSLGDRAFEVAVIERMVLDLHREPPLARVERWPFRDRPRLEHAVEFEAEIVVQSRGVVLLDDEASSFGPGYCGSATRFRRFFEIALSPVGRKFLVCGHAHPRLTTATPCATKGNADKARAGSWLSDPRQRAFKPFKEHDKGAAVPCSLIVACSGSSLSSSW